MLIRFAVSNFRSIAETQELTLVAIDDDRDGLVEAPLLGAKLLPVAGLYGPNASGKSTVLRAIAWLQQAVEQSLRSWDDQIPTEPFAFGDWPNQATSFEIEFLVQGVRFEYQLTVDHSGVEYEALFHYPERRRRRIFERRGLELRLQSGLGGVSGARKLLTPTTLGLSALRRYDEPVIQGFARELSNVTVLGISSSSPTLRYLQAIRSTRRIFEEEESPQDALFDVDNSATLRRQALAMLRMADLGVTDVEIDVELVEVPDRDGSTQTHRRLRTRLVHTIGSEQTALDRELESNGTTTWYNHIGPVLNALRSGSLVLFDEIDRSLHPTLTAQLLRLFASPQINGTGAQLIFTSHDTSLLAHLNRDQVWFTEKSPSRGSTRLGSLSDFAGERERAATNLERRYLEGRYGALPYVDEYGLLKEIGAID